jgi:hypothetical protein
MKMRKVRATILLVASLLIATLVAVPPMSARSTAVIGPEAAKVRTNVLEPVNMAILIQDDLVSHVSNELKITAEFIRSLPEGSRVMVGYITAGSLQVRQPFTRDLNAAAKSLRILVSNTSATPFNPYVEVLEALRKFDTKGTNRNVLLLVSDGLDTSRGFDASSVLFSIDLERAIKEAGRRKVAIYSFFAPSTGLTRRNYLLASYGQSSLNRISKETGGDAFFQGMTDFVSFNSHFERLAQALNQKEYQD